nr:hypothetical protein [Tanacetum cinerariifolium]
TPSGIPLRCDFRGVTRTHHVLPSSHLKIDDELTAVEAKQFEADDQAIQIILRGLLEDIYATVDSCNNAKEIWFAFVEWESIESYNHSFSKLMIDLDINQLTPKNIACNLKFLNNIQSEWKRYVTLVHQTKKLHDVDYNQLYDYLKQNLNEINEVRAEQLARTHDSLGFIANTQTPNLDGEECRKSDWECKAECKESDWTKCSTKSRYAESEEFDSMAAAANYEEIEKVNANCILMANLQQASTSGTHADKAVVYNLDGPAQLYQYENCYDNEIFNMFTQEEQYIELLESTRDAHLVQQDDSNVIPVDSSMNPSGRELEQHPTTIEETRAFFESLDNNLVIEVKKINTVNYKTKEANVKLTAELARYRGRAKSFE